MSTSAAGTVLTYFDPAKTREARLKPLSLKLIRRLFGYMRPYARTRNWLILLVLVRSVQLPILAWIAARVLSGPITAAAEAARQTGKFEFWNIGLGVAAFAALAILALPTHHLRARLSMEMGESVVHDLRHKLFVHLQRMTMSFYDRTKLGQIISRMTSDIEAVRSGVEDTLFVTLIGIGQVVVTAAIMISVDRRLFSVLLILAPFLWVINRYFRKKLSIAHRAAQESMSRITANLAETVHGIRVTQGFVRQNRNASMFGSLVADHSNYSHERARLQGVFTPLLETTNQTFTAALFVIGGYFAFTGTIEIDVFIQFLFLASVFFTAVQGIGAQYVQAMLAMAGAERIFALLDTKPQWTDPPDAVDLAKIRGRVQFKDLTFEYDPGRPVLYRVSFTAEPGQTVALVGHTGSGKSTIINLIAKFYLPTDGRLLIDGRDIRGIQSESLQRQMGIVLQQNFLFTGTVLDNIRLGRPEADDAEVREAARQLNCLHMINELPNGLYTEVGERGRNLSLGQRQLICFTRAMLADPRILILDEATSSVDTMTEARIQRALEVLLAHRTSFVVAHRLSTIRHADLILVLDQGRIVETGTHVDLLTAAGVYANLYRQFIRTCEGQ